MSSIRVERNPELPGHVLQLNLTHHHGHTTSSHRYTYPVHQSCFYDSASVDACIRYVSRISGIVFSTTRVEEITSCFLGIGRSMGVNEPICVIVNMDVVHPYVVVRDRLGRPFYVSNDDEEETMIIDGMSPDTIGSGFARVSVDLKKVIYEGATNGNDRCPICLDEFEDGISISSTPCSHLFHDNCIDEWIQKENMEAVCPLCRSMIVA